jgi:hypothetical protein
VVSFQILKKVLHRPVALVVKSQSSLASEIGSGNAENKEIPLLFGI